MIAMKSVQRRALKLVTSIKTVSYHDGLRHQGFRRRERVDLVEIFKIMNNIDHIEKEIFLQLYRMRQLEVISSNLLKIKQHRLKIRADSFCLRVIDSWNILPEKVIMAPSLNCFKSRQVKYIGPPL